MGLAALAPADNNFSTTSSTACTFLLSVNVGWRRRRLPFERSGACGGATHEISSGDTEREAPSMLSAVTSVASSGFSGAKRKLRR